MSPRRDEYRFIYVNLDSSRRKARSALRTQTRETVRGVIIDAAEELIAKHGLHHAALLQIAKRAGVAVGTLYNYFTDRDALIKALFESRRATLWPQLRAAVGAGAKLPFEARLRTFVRDVFTVFESHRRFLKIAIENEHAQPPSGTFATELSAGIADIVATGVREGIVAEKHADLLPLTIVGVLKAFLVHRISTGAELAVDADTIVAFLLDGARQR